MILGRHSLHIWVHTWHGKDNIVPATLESLRASDVGEGFRVERQPEGADRVDFALSAWRRAIESGRPWILRLEDDVLVNRHLLWNVCSWHVPHMEPDFGYAHLSLPKTALRDNRFLGRGRFTGCPYRNYRTMNFGGGMLVPAKLMKQLLPAYEVELRRPGKQMRNCWGLSAVCWSMGKHAYFHVPSIVKIDFQYPGGHGRMVNERMYGGQPYDAQFRRPLQPWMTYEGAKFFASILQPGMRVWEWGAGFSSIYLAGKQVRLTSVEHEPEFAKNIASWIPAGFEWDCRLRPPGKDADKSDPHRSARAPGCFRQYCEEIDGEPDQSLDVVIIDGRARNACASHAARKVKKGGWLCLDNSDRKDYGPIHRLLRRWPAQHFAGLGPPRAKRWTTSFWRRPHAY